MPGALGHGDRLAGMAVYIDPARWPAHGTVFSHMVSDTSLEELHEMAQWIGVSPRAFDGDHYDVAVAHYDRAVAEGAIEVDGKELARRLVQSGLRIPAARRSERAEYALRSRWDSALGIDPELRRLRTDLLERWSQPHRRYHDRTHLLAVLRALDLLTEDAPPRSVVLAAWFHDAVYDGRPGADEEASAELAERLLPEAGFEAAEVAEVARLVRLTASHRPADDAAGQLLCDADLAVLGGSPAEYADYVRRVSQEYASVPRPDFVRGRLQILEQLAGSRLYGTQKAQQLWAEQAAQNLSVEIDDLRFESLQEVQPPGGVDLLTIVGVCFLHEGRLLTVRKRGTQKFMLVGGKLEPGETAERAAQREVAEEVGAVISQEDLQLLGHFHSPAANEADTWISSTVFTIDLDEQAQQLLPQAEIEELRPLDLRPEAVAEAEAALAPLVRRQVIPLLRRRDRRFFSAGPR